MLEYGTYGETSAGSPDAVAFNAVDSSLVDMTTANEAKVASVPIYLLPLSESILPWSWTYLESTYAVKNKSA